MRDKACARDHSLRLKLPGLSSPSFAEDGLYCRHFISEDLRPRPYRTEIQPDYRSPRLLRRPCPSGWGEFPRSHTRTLARTREYPQRDRINRIRVWRIEFNVVITSDENARARARVPHLCPRRSSTETDPPSEIQFDIPKATIPTRRQDERLPPLSPPPSLLPPRRGEQFRRISSTRDRAS